ncbi:dihydrofolate reductase, partial [Candidatus Woesebacteria bacterium]|nr:dihydrofolate reductase [Candidatus Woesebacteria bacterium]
MKISIVVAVSKNGFIGKDGKIPWKVPDELAYFRKITNGHHVVMGRITQQSLGRPLKGRVNLVLSTKEGYEPEGFIVFSNFKDAINFAKEHGEEELMIIGGEKVYEIALPLAERIYMSVI